jgi:hypothetical protein
MPRGFSPSGPLDLTRVDAGAHLEAEPAERVPNRDAAPNRARRPVEHCEEAVAVVSISSPPKRSSSVRIRGVVAAEQLGPRRVPEAHRLLRRRDEVREEDGRAARGPVDGFGRTAGEELLDLVENDLGIGDERVVVSRKFHEPRPRDPLRDVPALVDLRVTVSRAMQDERRGLDHRKGRPGPRPGSS